MPHPESAEAGTAVAPPPAPDARPWYETAFDRAWLRAYAHRDDAEAERFAPHVLALLALPPGARVLDVACGSGRYSRAFARRGVRVTGVDLSETMLEEARERSADLPGAPTYVRWDIRELPFESQFEGAVSLFTSMGYFDDPEDDRRIFRGVLRALVPGGRFLIDYLNEARVRADVVESTDRAADGLRVVEERRIDEQAPGGPCVRKRVSLVHARTGHVEATFEERVRLYGADEIEEMLAEAGFSLRGERLGDLDGVPYDASSPRFVRVAERPLRRAPGRR